MKKIVFLVCSFFIFSLILNSLSASNGAKANSRAAVKPEALSQDRLAENFHDSCDEYAAVADEYFERRQALRMARRQVALDNMHLSENELRQLLDANEIHYRELELELEVMNRQMGKLRRESVAALRAYNGLNDTTDSLEVVNNRAPRHTVDAVSFNGAKLPVEVRERYIESLIHSRIEALVSPDATKVK